jgi:putative DNA methylase
MPPPTSLWRSRGYLPHWEGRDVPQAITFRLADSLPATLLDRWGEELAALPADKQDLERRKRIAAALDAGHGGCYLARPVIGALVEAALLHFDGSRYRVHGWVVMPNHVHVLITLAPDVKLSSVLFSWKSFSASKANEILHRKGRFWQREYYDRAIRSEDHFRAAMTYLEHNPVAAGLCERPEDWPHGSARLAREPIGSASPPSR